MLFQELLAGVVVFVSPVLPPILVPLSFSMLGVLIVQWANPWVLSGIMITSTVLEMAFIWWITWIILRRMEKYKETTHKPDFVTSIWRKFVGYLIRRAKANRASQRVDGYLRTRSGKVLIFLLAIFCSAPTVPDIITVRLFRRKMPFGSFIIAAFLGKIISFVPFVFFGKGILTLILK
jgi:membrane protein YqaA with SNARE-associated domain